MIQGDKGRRTKVKPSPCRPRKPSRVLDSDQTGNYGTNLQVMVLVTTTAFQHLDGVKLEVVACMWRLIRVAVLISM